MEARKHERATTILRRDPAWCGGRGSKDASRFLGHVRQFPAPTPQPPTFFNPFVLRFRDLDSNTDIISDMVSVLFPGVPAAEVLDFSGTQG